MGTSAYQVDSLLIAMIAWRIHCHSWYLPSWHKPLEIVVCSFLTIWILMSLKALSSFGPFFWCFTWQALSSTRPRTNRPALHPRGAGTAFGARTCGKSWPPPGSECHTLGTPPTANVVKSLTFGKPDQWGGRTWFMNWFYEQKCLSKMARDHLQLSGAPANNTVIPITGVSFSSLHLSSQAGVLNNSKSEA